MTDTNALLPCPFCGGEAGMKPWHGGGPDKQLIACWSDYCEARPAVTGETPSEAFAAWNTRATGHPTAEDYRNRAERAEAECAEIEARVTGELVAWLRELETHSHRYGPSGIADNLEGGYFARWAETQRHGDHKESQP